MATEILGPNSFVNIYPESTWGTKPGTPDYVFLPCDTFGIKTAMQSRSNKPMIGGRHTKHKQAFNAYPTGTIGGKLHGYVNSALSKSLAQVVCDLFFGSLTDNESTSWGAEFAQGPDVANRQFNGLKGDQLTIQGSAQSGVLEWSGSFVGKNEVTLATAQTLPTDLEKLVDFQFCDQVFKIATTAIGISSFSITRSLNQKVKWVNSRTPSCIKVGDIMTTINVQFLKNAVTYDTISRLMASAGTMNDLDIDIILKGDHNGTGTNTYTRCSIDAPRCVIDDVDDKLSVDDVFEQGLAMTVLKPDSSTAPIALTWDTV